MNNMAEKELPSGYWIAVRMKSKPNLKIEILSYHTGVQIEIWGGLNQKIHRFVHLSLRHRP